MLLKSPMSYTCRLINVNKTGKGFLFCDRSYKSPWNSSNQLTNPIANKEKLKLIIFLYRMKKYNCMWHSTMVSCGCLIFTTKYIVMRARWIREKWVKVESTIYRESIHEYMQVQFNSLNNRWWDEIFMIALKILLNKKKIQFWLNLLVFHFPHCSNILSTFFMNFITRSIFIKVSKHFFLFRFLYRSKIFSCVPFSLLFQNIFMCSIFLSFQIFLNVAFSNL